MPHVNGRPQHANFRHAIWFSHVLFNGKCSLSRSLHAPRAFIGDVQTGLAVWAGGKESEKEFGEKTRVLGFCNSSGRLGWFVTAKHLCRILRWTPNAMLKGTSEQNSHWSQTLSKRWGCVCVWWRLRSKRLFGNRKRKSNNQKSKTEKEKKGLTEGEYRKNEWAHKGLWVWACAVVGCGLERGKTLVREHYTSKSLTFFNIYSASPSPPLLFPFSLCSCLTTGLLYPSVWVRAWCVCTVHYMHVCLRCERLSIIHRLRSRKAARLHSNPPPPPEKTWHSCSGVTSAPQKTAPIYTT